MVRLYSMYAKLLIAPLIVLFSVVLSPDDQPGKTIIDKTPIISGQYDDGLNLAYDPSTKQITGFFAMERGDDHGHPQFSCEFYIEGKLENGWAKIKTYFPPDSKTLVVPADDTINGLLVVQKNGNVSIKLNDEHGGCQMTGETFKDSPVEFSKSKVKPWISIRYVRSDKTYFYSAPDEGSRGKAYLVKGDIVYLSKKDAQWIFATYVNQTGKDIKGWLKAEDINKL